jgi:hypothetical protein
VCVCWVGGGGGRVDQVLAGRAWRRVAAAPCAASAGVGLPRQLRHQLPECRRRQVAAPIRGEPLDRPRPRPWLLEPRTCSQMVATSGWSVARPRMLATTSWPAGRRGGGVAGGGDERVHAALLHAWRWCVARVPAAPAHAAGPAAGDCGKQPGLDGCVTGAAGAAAARLGTCSRWLARCGCCARAGAAAAAGAALCQGR